MSDPPTRTPSEATLGARLDSWKEIAAYLKRDVRTAQRWEKQEELPVHRHLHDERGTAYAYSGEIDEWLRKRSRREDDARASADSESQPAGSTPLLHKGASRRRARLLWTVLAFASLASGISIWTLLRSAPDRSRVSSLSVVFPPSQRFREWGPDMALSPDGSTLVYNPTTGPLHVRRIDELEGRALEGTEGSRSPFFSPDGRWIGFNRGGELMKVSIDGGAPVSLGARAGFIGAADWGSDGQIVYANITPDRHHGLYRLPANGGSPQLITALDGSADDAYWLTPQSLSNGKIILCTEVRSGPSSGRFQVVAVNVATGERRLLVDDARHAIYVGDGVLVYLRNEGLFATKLDLDRLEVTGPHVAASDDVFIRLRMRSWTYAGGTLVYWPKLRAEHRLVWVDRSGTEEPLPLRPALYQSPRVAPDGRSIVFAIGFHSEFSDIWRYDLSSGSSFRLTNDGQSGTPLWRLDGSGVVFSSMRGTGRDLFELRLDNGHPAPERVPLPARFLSGAPKYPGSWTDGGRTLILKQLDRDAEPALWAVPRDSSREPEPLAVDAYDSNVSPDGRWIAYASRESARSTLQVYVAPLPAGRPQLRVSTDGGSLPVWARSGRELFYRNGGRMMSVTLSLGDTLTASPPRVLFERAYYEGEPGGPNYDIDVGDRRFLMVALGSTEGPDRLNVIQGWKTEILRRLRESS